MKTHLLDEAFIMAIVDPLVNMIPPFRDCLIFIFDKKKE